MPKKYKVLECFGHWRVGDTFSSDERVVDFFDLGRMLSAHIIEEVVERPRLKGMPLTGAGAPSGYRLNALGEGDVYATNQDATEAEAWYKARTRLIHAAARISGGENGWVNGKVNWSCTCDSTSGIFKSNSWSFNRCTESFLYFRTRNQAEQFAKECEADLKVYLGF